MFLLDVAAFVVVMFVLSSAFVLFYIGVCVVIKADKVLKKFGIKVRKP